MSKSDHPLLQVLKQAVYTERPLLREGVSEYQLIRKLSGAPYFIFDAEALRENLTLFQTHFLLFHCLYLLQQEWSHKGENLTVCALRIHLSTYTEPTQGQLPAVATPLKSYYLNWDNFVQTASSDIAVMLDNFWQKMFTLPETITRTDIDDAVRILQLNETQWQHTAMLKQQYRKLLHQCHPDKGGDHHSTQQLTQAYQLLLKVNSNAV